MEGETCREEMYGKWSCGSFWIEAGGVSGEVMKKGGLSRYGWLAVFET